MDPTVTESKEQQPHVFEEPSEDGSEPAKQQRFEQWAQQSHETLQGSFDTLKVRPFDTSVWVCRQGDVA
jgi:hypothetical protein